MLLKPRDSAGSKNPTKFNLTLPLHYKNVNYTCDPITPDFAEILVVVKPRYTGRSERPNKRYAHRPHFATKLEAPRSGMPVKCRATAAWCMTF